MVYNNNSPLIKIRYSMNELVVNITDTFIHLSPIGLFTYLLAHVPQILLRADSC